MVNYKATEQKISKGYEMLAANKSIEACDYWLDAWADIKVLLGTTKAKTIRELDGMYPWEQMLENLLMDIEMELGNAGIDKKEYYHKRIAFCEDVLALLAEIDNGLFRQALANSYYEIGEEATCDERYTKWLMEDPNWGWGYIYWADNRTFGRGRTVAQKTMAIETLKRGLANSEVKDRADILERIITVYEDLGNKEEIIQYQKELQEERKKNAASLQGDSQIFRSIVSAPVTPTQTNVEKVGRNDPCPCGSGKKYKKCHG